MTLGLILLWIAGVLLMAGLIELWLLLGPQCQPWVAPGVLVPRSSLRLLYASRVSAGSGSGALGGSYVSSETKRLRRRTLRSQVQPEPSPVLLRRVIKRLVRESRDGATRPPDPVVEHLVAAHQRTRDEKGGDRPG